MPLSAQSADHVHTTHLADSAPSPMYESSFPNGVLGSSTPVVAVNFSPSRLARCFFIEYIDDARIRPAMVDRAASQRPGGMEWRKSHHSRSASRVMSVRVVDAAQRLRGSLPACVVRGRSSRTTSPRRALHVVGARAHEGVVCGWRVAAGGGGGVGRRGSRARRCVCGATGDDDANDAAAPSSSSSDTLSALDAMLGIDAEAEASKTTARADAAITGTGDPVSATSASSSSSASTKADTLSALDAMLGIDPEAEAAEKAAAAAADAARQKRRQEAEAARTAAAASGAPPREKRMGTVQVRRHGSADRPLSHRAVASSNGNPRAPVGQAGWVRSELELGREQT